jgi:hypothetical protein
MHYVRVPVTPTEPASPAARRVALPSWLDLRLVLGVLLVLGSVLLGAKVVSSARETYPRVTARHDLAAGTILTAQDVTLARVQLPGHGDGLYLPRVEQAVGKQLARPVSAGELVPRAALGEVAAQTTVTVPLDAQAAPELRKGERIELWLSTSSCASTVLLADVTVQAVRADPDQAFGDGGGAQDVVISVSPALADRVVQALAFDQARLRAGVLVGAAPPAPVLPDLAACAGPPAPR